MEVVNAPAVEQREEQSQYAWMCPTIDVTRCGKRAMEKPLSMSQWEQNKRIKSDQEAKV